MKYLFVLIFCFSGILNAQNSNQFAFRNTDLSDRIHNKDTFYEGEVNRKFPYKVTFESVLKNTKYPEKYLVKGISEYEGKFSKFEGEIVFKESFEVKNRPYALLNFGDFNFSQINEEGITEKFVGKVRMEMLKDVSIENYSITFKGTLRQSNSDTTEIWFGNLFHNNFDKVIFR